MAAFSAAALSLAEAPWTRPEALAPGAVLLIPSAIVASSVALFLGKYLWRASLATVCVCAASGVTLLVGAYYANVLLVAEPLAAPTFIGYAVAVICAVAIGAFVHTAVRLPRVSAILTRGSVRGFGGSLALFFGLLAACADAVLYPQFYRTIHLAIEGIALGSFALAAHGLGAVVGRRGAGGALLGAWMLIGGAQGISGLEPAAATLLRHPTVHRRAWLAILPAPPLGPLKVSCDAADRPKAPEPVAADVTPPRLLVLVTMDAFRCGFARDDRPTLRDACPELTKLLGVSRYRLDAHASAPSTVRSTRAMQVVADVPLAERLRQAGFVTHVIATHDRILRGDGVRSSFDEVDEELVPIARSGVVSTSRVTTARAVSTLKSMAGDGGNHYLWVHYFDAHAPYVEDPGSPWRISDIAAYRTEVGRVDAAVGELVDAARGLSVPVTFVITADHGEEFGEHLASAHGGNLYEPATRIPVIVWRSSPTLALPAGLPSSSVEVGEYLLALALSREFRSSEVAWLSAETEDDEQYGVVEGGYKLIEHHRLGYRELYDLKADPQELHDLSVKEASRADALACALHAHLER